MRPALYVKVCISVPERALIEAMSNHPGLTRSRVLALALDALNARPGGTFADRVSAGASFT